jgi:hypothetical protein
MINKLTAWNDNPLHMLFDPKMDTKDIPIILSEPVMSNTGELGFEVVPWRIETSDAERIGVDHAVHTRNAGDEKEIKRIMIS